MHSAHSALRMRMNNEQFFEICWQQTNKRKKTRNLKVFTYHILLKNDLDNSGQFVSIEGMQKSIHTHTQRQRCRQSTIHFSSIFNETEIDTPKKRPEEWTFGKKASLHNRTLWMKNKMRCKRLAAFFFCWWNGQKWLRRRNPISCVLFLFRSRLAICARVVSSQWENLKRDTQKKPFQLNWLGTVMWVWINLGTQIQLNSTIGEWIHQPKR